VIKGIVKIGPLLLIVLVIATAALPAQAVDNFAWDASGDGLLNGTYNFREVMWRNGSDLSRVAMYGTIVFDGNGNYTITASVFNSALGAVQPFSRTDAYRISAGGLGYLNSPILTQGSGSLWGLVSQGIFIGSSTEDGLNDLFIAVKAGSSTASNSSFSGNYWTAAMNLPSSNVAQARDMLFPLNPNGQGGLGAVNVSGFIGNGSAPVTQTINSAQYSFSSGIMTLAFGDSLLTQPLLAGNVECYLSPDGNFFVGGSRTGWDMLVGVRALPGSAAPDLLSGLYYQAGADVDTSADFNSANSYYGAFTAAPGVIVGHQRILSGFDASRPYLAYDYTYSDPLKLAADGTNDDFFNYHHLLGAGGAIRIGYGTGSRRGINVTLKAPDFSGSGVYLNPVGVSNGASSAPFTVGISRGGFMALYGTNLASAPLQDGSMPFMLGGVQVLVNGRKAPIYYVSSGLILAVAPFATSGSVASVQVINDQGASATRTAFVDTTTPGVFTKPPGGVGLAIGQHVQDNSYAEITLDNGARPGETVLIYVAGLGDVDPAVGDGVSPPSNPLSFAKASIHAFVDNEEATVGFAGLSPSLVGVYAMTVTIPADIAPGKAYLDIQGPDSYTTEAQIAIASSGLADQPNGVRGPAHRLTRSAEPAVRPPGSVRQMPAP
jgi:uncharacterized protein (TIGR03437 family)